MTDDDPDGLMDALLQGDETAVQKLLERYLSVIRYEAIRQGGSWADELAEDILVDFYIWLRQEAQARGGMHKSDHAPEDV